mmetsp:Transcript_29661/g.36101  ORF Transcript_29661/g.36101 Transcript_29661/m.36101 type:complete len:298 (-) Transcript_29661:1401-2294(-)
MEARNVLLALFVVVTVRLCVRNLETFLHKLKLSAQGIAYLLFCNDKAWKKPADPAQTFEPFLQATSSQKIEKKTFVFVRHGESTWNDTFNKGPHRSLPSFVIGFIPNLIKALSYEYYLLVTGQMDSWFYDSPISHLGLKQVDQLGKFLSEKPTGGKEKSLIELLRSDPGAPSSKLLSSNLRRALSTMAASFRYRLKANPDEKILVVPSLQEISRNPDTLSITPAQKPTTPSFIDKETKICDMEGIFVKQTDMSLHLGNKPMDTNGLKRMSEFCDFAFTLKEEALIIGGHSIWFRSFF